MTKIISNESETYFSHEKIEFVKNNENICLNIY